MKYLATTFGIAFRENGCIYAAIIEDFADIVTINGVLSKYGYIAPSKANNEIFKEYAREVVYIDTVAEFERKAKNWNKRHREARYRGWYFEIAFCRATGAKRNTKQNAKHTEDFDCILNGEGIELKYIKGVY